MERRATLRLIGLVILVLGLLSAVAIFAHSVPATVTVGLDDGVPDKREMVQIEQFGGKGNLVAIEITTWFSSLWHGRRLAYTVAVLSIAIFATCRWAADLSAEDSASSE